MVIFDTDARPNLIREKIIMSALTKLLQTVKASRLRPASNNHMNDEEIINLPLQSGKHYEQAGFLVVPYSATNILLYTAFISWHIEKV